MSALFPGVRLSLTFVLDDEVFLSGARKALDDGFVFQPRIDLADDFLFGPTSRKDDELRWLSSA